MRAARVRRAEADGRGELLPGPEFMSPADGARLLTMLRPVPGSCGLVQCIAAHPGEGVSSVARDLALVAARVPELRVLLLDLDPPGRRQAEWLQARHAGLAGSAEAVTQSLPGAAGQLAVTRFGTGLHVSEMQGAWPGAGIVWNGTIAVLRASFDMIVVDSPSLQTAFEGVMLAPQMDANLIVVEAEATRAAVVQNLRDQLMEVGAPIAGVVLNKRRFHIPGFIYRYI